MPEDPRERFLDAAVAPLADNAELQLAARAQLEAKIAEASSDSHLDAAVERLASPGSDSRTKRRRIILIIATLLLSAYPLATHVQALWRSRDAALEMGDIGSSSHSGTSELYRGLPAEATRLLMGGKELWDSDPENSLYFADYAIRYVGNHEELPPKFLETAKKLDPDNLWFTSYAAGMIAKGSVKAETQTQAQRKAREPRKYSIDDPVKLKEALDLLHEAVQQKSFSSPQGGLMEQRAKALPKETDFLSRIGPYAYIAGQPMASLRLHTLSDAVNAQAADLEIRGDASGLKSLVSDWETVLTAWLGEPHPPLIDALVTRALLDTNSRQFSKSCAALGLSEEAARWKKIDERLAASREERDRHSSAALTKRLKQRGSMLGAMALPTVSKQVAKGPAITDDDLLAMRSAEHELMSRIAAIAVWLILLLMVLLAGPYHFRGGRAVRRLSRRVEALLLPVDWAWIIGAGVILPLAWQQVVLRFTPLGGLGWSLAGSQFMVPTGAFTAMAWMMIMAPVAVARWRLGIRADFLGFARPRAWTGWLAAGCAALAIPALGIAWGSGDTFSKAGLGLVGLLITIVQVLWWVTGIRALCSRREELLRRVSISRALVPAYAAGMLAMAAALPFFHAQEQSWIAKDAVMRPAPERGSLNLYEANVATALQQELKDLLKGE